MNGKLVRYLLEQRMFLPRSGWTVHGGGVLRLQIDGGTSMHIWDGRLQLAGCSNTWDRAQCTVVVSGLLFGDPYVEVRAGGEPYHTRAVRYDSDEGVIVGLATDLFLLRKKQNRYSAGEGYVQPPAEIHRISALSGTVVLVEQAAALPEEERVFWPHGAKFVSAEPRPATREEIYEIGKFALDIFKPR
jgi:hypothetical protein